MTVLLLAGGPGRAERAADVKHRGAHPTRGAPTVRGAGFQRHAALLVSRRQPSSRFCTAASGVPPACRRGTA